MFKFVNPYFLIALISVAIPIIIHLFNFRKFRKVFFTNVRFLKELKQETQKQSKLKHLLVLFSRILALVCLVLAFAQPYLPVSENMVNAKSSLVSVYIDNSFSMQSIATSGILLEEAKKKALEISSTYKSSDQFQLLTNDFEGRQQRFVTKEEFEMMVKEVVISPASRNIAKVIARQNELFLSNRSDHKVSYLISDFQKSTSAFTDIKADSTISTYLIPMIPEKTANAFIDSCWFDAPVFQLDHQIKLVVRIKNNSEIALDKIPVKLTINHQQKAVASIDVAAHSEAEVNIPFTIKEKGIQQGSVEIIDFPVTFDDKFYFSFTISDQIPILSINNSTESPYINSLFRKDSAFTYSSTTDKTIDYSTFKKSGLIILNEITSISTGLAQELKQYIEKGGSCIIFPGARSDIKTYQSFLSSINSKGYSGIDTVNTKVTSINTAHHIYADVFEKIPENIDLPMVYTHYVINRSSSTDVEYLLKLQNSQYFLTCQNCGKGKLYLCASPLNPSASNFVKHDIFVPTLYNIALYSGNYPILYYTLGVDKFAEAKGESPAKDHVYKISDENAKTEVIPENKVVDNRNILFFQDQIRESGNYFLSVDGKKIDGLAFNYSRAESDLKFFNTTEISNQLKTNNLKNFSIINTKNRSLSQALNEFNQGIRLWKLFVILGLLFIAIEIILLRFWK